MCGICGFLHVEGDPVDAGLDERMTELLRHRGPEGEGHLEVPGQPPPSVYLGHRRLKIIDLSDAARQPPANEDGTVWRTFHGQISNHLAQPEALERRRHRF